MISRTGGPLLARSGASAAKPRCDTLLPIFDPIYRESILKSLRRAPPTPCSERVSRTLVLWQNANADLPGCHAYRKGENDRSLITSDKQNPTAQPGTDCQIEFRLIHTTPRHAISQPVHATLIPRARHQSQGRAACGLAAQRVFVPPSAGARSRSPLFERRQIARQTRARLGPKHHRLHISWNIHTALQLVLRVRLRLACAAPPLAGAGRKHGLQATRRPSRPAHAFR
jgi:hypothetical protein